MLVGYARVSTVDQNLDLQIEALQQAGCELIFTDKGVSGSKFPSLRPGSQERPGLQEAMSQLKPGWTLVTWKLDRLGRGVKGLVALVGELESMGCEFRSITESLNTSSPAGRLFFHILASMGQMERELTIERTQAGLQSARLRGRVGGRRRKMTAGKIQSASQLLDSGMSPRDVAMSLGVSVPTLYRWVPASGRNLNQA